MGNEKDLSDIRNLLYDKAEWRWSWSLCFALFAQVSALAALWLNKPDILITAGLISIIAPIVEVWFKEWGDHFTQKADKCRRLILYADGFGEEIPKEEVATILAWVTNVQPKQAPFIRPYYASSLPYGPQRLADIVAESSYYTSHLADRITGYLTFLLALSVALLFAILYFSLTNATPTNGLLSLARSAVSIMPFILAGNTLLLRKKYSDLYNTSNETFRLCARLRCCNNLQSHDILRVVEDYHLALIQSPPIPLKIYLKYRDALNEAYKRSHSIEECKNG